MNELDVNHLCLVQVLPWNLAGELEKLDEIYQNSRYPADIRTESLQDMSLERCRYIHCSNTAAEAIVLLSKTFIISALAITNFLSSSSDDKVIMTILLYWMG